jgi:hypothetical protein
MAATRRNRAGSVALAAARAMRMTPSSSGWRRLSSTEVGNSPSSSRNSTPPLASETSPGWIMWLPPPTSDTADALWWGLRNGGRRSRPSPGRCSPAAEWTRVASIAWSTDRSGSNPGRRRASIDLPDPGGPTISRW